MTQTTAQQPRPDGAWPASGHMVHRPVSDAAAVRDIKRELQHVDERALEIRSDSRKSSTP